MSVRGRQAGPRDGAAAEDRRTPRQEAIRVLAEWPAAQPIPGVDMTSAGRLLIVGEAAAALGWAEKLRGKLEPTVLATTALTDADRPDDERYPVFAGRVRRLAGHLGAYTIEWETEEAAGATPAVRSESFDLVLDLCEPPLLRRVVLPDGYQAPGRDPLDQALAVIELLPLVGEFEKPQYVALQANLCAHSRATLQGCNNCIEVCATAAIVAKGDTVGVDPYLCQGCGTCATVCPSGALRYQYPRVADLGARLRALLAAYRGAGGEAACLLFHSATSGRELVDRLARRGALPARVIPLETWSADAVGIDLLLAAIALGASQVAILAAGSHDSAPLQKQARIGAAVLNGLGYAGQHFRIIDSREPDAIAAELRDWAPAQGVAVAASFCPQADKRATLDLAISYLSSQAPQPQAEIALPDGAPFGSVAASAACTLCMGCVGSCPAGALLGGTETPRLSFIEHNCLQCGLCVQSCPEGALTMTPRLLLQGARRERLLREAEIFRCTRCGKPMGARPLIEAMASRLAGHSMFASEAARARLRMCGDCRVVDLIEFENRPQAAEINQ